MRKRSISPTSAITQHRGVGADPAQLAEHVDARVVAGERIDLAFRQLDLPVEVADQAEQAVESPARRLAQRELGEEATAAAAEEVGVLVLDALAGEQCVHAVLQRRAHPRHTTRWRSRSRRSRSSRGAMYASGSRSVRSRCASVRASTASVFTRAAAIAFVRKRMREVQLVPLLLEQVGQPLPAVGRLERDL